MYTLTKAKVGLMGLLATALLLSVFTFAAQSQDSQETIQLAISPQVFELNGNPGDVIENAIRLENQSEGAVKIEPVPKNFTARGEEGAVDLTEDNTSFSLAEWISVSPAEIIIPGNTSQDFNISISIPENAEPGGHFGSVVFRTVPPDAEGQGASVSQEIAPVILLKVAGDLVENASLADFKSTKSFWSNERPITFETRIENTGNVHFKPSGQITIKNMFGNEVTTINLDERNVIPDSIRKLTTEWSDPGFALGRYTAELTMIYGDQNTIIESTTSFIIFPYQTVVPAVILIVALMYVGIRFRRRLGMAVRVLSGRN